ncbi:TauD/TfdA dioxygenase family protein [Parasphingorhabdus halotolerans]|uniref:TauD/TfdA family dioxygenase n=1 Tax=Parasphingorhabdus halotolerans TaxID=2725558 RepID=A0A6H2DJ28_9SPHN|nr:TauD/TfdA family dioxygenase [Parasphingorhabdus halotolerans]QJB68198.1 TauD/TfdA family dioxygenase [Parasphingorhabdus halotolerans]
MTSIKVTPSGQACGASVTGVDLTQPLDAPQVADIRTAWLEHHVLSFPDQAMTDDDLERFTQYFGDFGHDPFFDPIEGRAHIAAIQRNADEKSPLFAENWHSDWSFQAHPPAGTCLMGITIPPVGGDTLFANQHAALDAMPPEMRAKYQGLTAIHSAQLAYAPDGAYGDKDEGRSMAIRPNESARKTQFHPLIRAHPETGRLGIFSCMGYIIGFEGMAQEDALPLLQQLYAWQSREEFIYRHKWQPNMLIMWDNRSVLHCATGGYEGHDRLLHRTTIAAYQV